MSQAYESPVKQSSVLTGANVSLDSLLALRHKRHLFKPGNTSKVVGNRAGIKLSKIKGRGADFSEVRPYQPGDDIRAIDWRVTARKNKPHTKIFREERERPTLVVVDQTQNMFFGSKIRLKSVAAAELAARIAWQNLQAGDRVGGIVVGNTNQSVFRPFRTSKAVARFLHSVADYNQRLARQQFDPTASIVEGLLRVRRLTHTNYRIFVLSDFSGDLTMWQNNLHQLARHNQVVVVHITDPLEEELPPADHYAITDGVTRLQLYTGDTSLRSRYRQKFQERCSELASLCAHDAMNYLQIETGNEQLDTYNWV